MMPNSYVPNLDDKSFDNSPVIKKRPVNMAMSVIPGQFIGNTKKMKRSKNLAQSVGFGLGEDGSLKALGSLRSGGGLLGQLAHDANLPEEMDADREQFNCKTFCELCDRTFNKFKSITRHHCRKCFRSVCTSCSGNKRKLSKNDD